MLFTKSIIITSYSNSDKIKVILAMFVKGGAIVKFCYLRSYLFPKSTRMISSDVQILSFCSCFDTLEDFCILMTVRLNRQNLSFSTSLDVLEIDSFF